MPRSNRPRRRKGARPNAGQTERPGLELTGLQRVETHPDGDWIVRRTPGGAAHRRYVCPGCQQTVSGASAHVVAWPADVTVGSGAAVDSRRHWHTPCWAARDRRGPR